MMNRIFVRLFYSNCLKVMVLVCLNMFIYSVVSKTVTVLIKVVESNNYRTLMTNSHTITR